MEIYYESRLEVNKFHSLYTKPSSGFHKTDFPWQESNTGPKELSGFDDRLKRESSIALRLGGTGNNNINCTQTTANVDTDLLFFFFSYVWFYGTFGWQ